MNLLKVIITTSLMFLTTLLYANITVLKVEGTVAYKDGNRWLPVKVGQKLVEGVKISTGADSFVDIKLNSKNHIVQVKQLSMVQIFSKETGTDTNTNIGLKRGSVNTKVPRDENVKTVFKVSTPIATSSVRGTEQNVSYGPDSGMVIEVLSGEVEGKNTGGRTNRITGRQKFVQSSLSGNPQHILQEVRDNAIIQVSGQGLTNEERESMLYSDEQIGSPGGDISILGKQSHGGNKGNVDVVVDFEL